MRAWRRLPAERLLTAGLVALFVVLLHLSYRDQVAPVFGDIGFSYHAPSVPGWIAIFGLAIIPGLLMSPACRRPSDALAWAFYALGYVPICLVPVLASDRFESVSRPRIFWLLAVCCIGMVIIAAGRGPLARLPRPKIRRLDRNVTLLVLALFSAATYGLSLVYFQGFSLVGFDNVDAIREQLSEGIAAGGKTLGYLVWTQSHAVNPLLIAAGVAGRRWGLLTTGLLGQVFFYLSGGLRAVIMSPFLVFGAWLGMRDRGRHVGHVMLAACAGMVLVFLVLAPADPIGGGRAWGIVRVMFWRTFVIPAHTVGIYFDAFSYLPITHFGHVKGFSLFFKNPYDEAIGVVMARWFYHSYFSANGGVFAEGFAGWAAPGIIVVSVVTALALAALDAVTVKLPNEFVVLAISFHVLNLTNISIFTLLLGSGLGASMLILAIMSPSFAAPRRGTASPPGVVPGVAPSS